jgi:NitT/TauT family transport system substrate-binding protein
MTNSPPSPKLLRALLLIVTLAFLGCQPAERAPQGPALKLSMAIQAAPYSRLIAIADEKGYFKAAGLEVTLNLYPSGKQALEAVCRGEAEVATVTDSAFAAKALEEPSIRVIASIGRSTGNQIVARRDRNIQYPADLIGKVVGYTADTTSDYFLHTFLITENIPRKSIRMVHIPAAQQAEALINGDVDAISAFEINASEAEKRLGDNAVSWDSQNSIAFHWLLAVNENTTKSPESLKRLLKALIKAENFATLNEEETRSIISRKWGFDPIYIQDSWQENRVGISFGQSIVIALQEFAIWNINNADKPTIFPNVLHYLHTAVLDEVAPKLVTIFR